MGAILTRIEDPSDKLDKALPDELYFWGRKNGVMDLKRDMPADLMRQELRKRGLVDIPIPNRILGQPIDWRNEWSQGSTKDPVASISAEQLLRQQWEERNGKIPEQPTKDPIASVSAEQLLRQQWEERNGKIPEPPKETAKNAVTELLVDNMSIQQLRRECRARNIKLARTDNLKTLRDKLRVV